MGKVYLLGDWAKEGYYKIGVTKGDIEKLATLSGVHDFVQKDGKATFSADNEAMNTILTEATKLGVIKIESVPPTLEDLFMRHYEG